MKSIAMKMCMGGHISEPKVGTTDSGVKWARVGLAITTHRKKPGVEKVTNFKEDMDSFTVWKNFNLWREAAETVEAAGKGAYMVFVDPMLEPWVNDKGETVESYKAFNVLNVPYAKSAGQDGPPPVEDGSSSASPDDDVPF